MDKHIPSLLDYAKIIDWMTKNPGKAIPVSMEKIYKDAICRVELNNEFTSLSNSMRGRRGFTATNY